MLKLKSGQPECGKTYVNMLVGKEQLELENKIILGVDVIHRAKIMIHSNGHHFALIGRLERENGQITKVRLQPHLWQKELEIKHGELDSQVNEMISSGSSKILFTCAASIKNKNIINKNILI